MKTRTKKREKIIGAATSLFSRWGYAKTSLEDVARGAHIAKATIYYYFSSKEDVFIAAIREKAEELFQALVTEIDSVPSFEEKLSRFLKLPMRYIFENMPILGEALRQIPEQYLSKLEENRADYRSRMQHILASILECGREQGILEDNVNVPRLSETINDWFLFGDTWVDISEKERIIQRIERDHDLIINLILYGIVKRGSENAAASKKKAKGKP